MLDEVRIHDIFLRAVIFLWYDTFYFVSYVCGFNIKKFVSDITLEFYPSLTVFHLKLI